MGCVNTKKQTKDEDSKKPTEKEEKKDEKIEEKKEEETPEQNGTVEKAAEEEGASPAEVEIAVSADGDKSADGADADLTAFREEALKMHNRQRALHGVPELTLRDDLNEGAQKWAEKMAEAGGLKHTPGADRKIDGEMFGENLAFKNFGSSDQAAVDKFNPSAEDYVMMWYNESVDPGFEYGKAEMQPNTGHFTQVVWKSTTAFGIGRVRVQEGNSVNVFVCAQYIPAGNFQGEYVDNVLAKQS